MEMLGKVRRLFPAGRPVGIGDLASDGAVAKHHQEVAEDGQGH